ncbi:hypothetical protein [Arthrobacter sp. HY1533]|uniref:hypothetical protein n=1 Tax=Arthrobacter sp. HY1533 TaxID=2970919 RepID=UPI0022BA024E|nr:hypothetical protein [Arthrobacter sp. HY1533]
MSNRSDLRNTILTAIKRSMHRPRYRGSEELADELTVTVRRAQADAWTRGWAAGRLDDASDHCGRRPNPYMGGRHAGPFAPAGDFIGRTPGDQYVVVGADTNNAVAVRVTGTFQPRAAYPQTNPYPEPK